MPLDHSVRSMCEHVFRFKHPALLAVAQERKTLDARPLYADRVGDAVSRYAHVRVGSIVECASGGSARCWVRVASRTCFDSFASAWSFYDSLGVSQDLLPDGWAQSVLARPVRSAADAALMYRALKVKDGDGPVVVFGMSMVRADDALTCCGVINGRDYPSAAQALASAEERVTVSLRTSDADDRTVANVASPPCAAVSAAPTVSLLKRVFSAWRRVAPPSDRRAYLLFCLPGRTVAQGGHCMARVLVTRDTTDPQALWQLPGLDDVGRQVRGRRGLVRELYAAADVTTTAAESAVSALQSSLLPCATRRAYASESTAVAIDMVGRPLPRTSCQWGWVDEHDVARLCSLPVASSLAVADAVAQWACRPEAIMATYAAVPTQLGSLAAPTQLGSLAARGRALRAHIALSRRSPVAPLHLLPRPYVDVVPAAEVEGCMLHGRRRFVPTLTDAAEHELARVAVIDASAGCADGKSHHVDEEYVRSLLTDARERAQSRGSSRVTPRDVAAAAMAASRGLSDAPSPAAALPVHYDELVAELRSVEAMVQRHLEAGLPRPRVLVCGEVHGTLARHLKMAGVDAATCDLKPTRTPEIPHFHGDAKWVRDLGWDMVINHPPCTYLSNAGSVWLKRDPHRYEQVIEGAAVYRSMRSANAPYIVTENPKMHALAKKLTGRVEVQYVHPWQHGTGDSKPTGLERTMSSEATVELRPLEPTCIVQGRVKAMANMPDTPDRGDKRSQTYVGIAAAMALQWTPTLLEHLKNTKPVNDRQTASEAVTLAARYQQQEAAKVVFWSRLDGEIAVLTHDRADGKGRDVFGGLKEVGDQSIGHTLVREVEEEVRLHPEWKRNLKSCVQSHIAGHVEQSLLRHHSREQHHVHVWAVEIPIEMALECPILTHGGVAEVAPGSMQWRPLETAFASDGPVLKGYAELLRKAVISQVNSSDESVMSLKFQPWMDPPRARSIVEPPVTQIRYNARSKCWRSWGLHEPEDKKKERRFAWTPLPPELDERLTTYFKPMQGRKPLSSALVSEMTSRAPNLTEDPLLAEWLAQNRQSGRTPDGEGHPSDDQGTDENPVESRGATSLLTGTMGVTGVVNHGRSTSSEHRVAALSNREERAESTWDGIRKEWASMKPGKSIKNLGIGATGETGSSRHWPSGPCGPRIAQAARCEFIEHDYRQSFVRPTASADTVANTELEDTPTESLEGTGRQYPRNCLYMKGVTVCRWATTRKGLADRSDQRNTHYLIDVALTFVRSLGDTGAGPSCVTTELLAQLPGDACVSRDFSPILGNTIGPDGKTLRTHGKATIVFDLNGTLCKHEFTVVEGKPLFLLGNDFLDARRAIISLNQDGAGGGSIQLTSLRRGTEIRHRIDVTCNYHDACDAKAKVSRDRQATTSPFASGSSMVANVSQDDTGNGEASALDSDQSAAGGDADATAETSVETEIKMLPRVSDHGKDSKGTACPDPASMLDSSVETDQSEHMLYSERAIVLPPRRTATVWLRAPLHLKGARLAQYLIEHLPVRAGVDYDVPAVECRAVRPDADHRVPVTIWNTSRKPLHIPAFSPVALLNVEFEVLSSEGKAPCRAAVETYEELSEVQQKLIDSIVVDPDHRLTEEQKLRVRDMLARHISAFALDSKDPGKTHVMEVGLPLKEGAVPHRHSASRVGEAGREIIEKHVAEMEAKGIIRKSNSPWSSRVVLVKKKDGATRFCIDYRDCNSKLLYLDSPIPLTVEALDKLSSGTGDPSTMFLTTLDLASGFWCLPIKEADKEITAFSTGRAKYEFNYLPFGIQSGPSYMCRLMDAVLQGLAWETCMPYLDDVGIWSTGQDETASFEQMLQRIDQVLTRLEGASLTCNAKKCILFATETPYLGHVVGRQGLKMDPEKIRKVSEIDPESINTLERVRAFLGLTSYYRRFIAGFSKTAAPLTDLTQKGVDVEVESQTAKCQQAVVALKNAIIAEPVLAAPRFDRQFRVKTDAAQTEGLGGILAQFDDYKHEHVVAYYGRRLTKHERNYTVTEIELLAALESIRNWRPYLWGRQFKLIVDHAALKWLHTMRDTIEGGPASRLMRWIMKLSEYNFEVEHKAGVLHTDSDGLSRLVAALDRCEKEVDQVVAAADDSEHSKPQRRRSAYKNRKRARKQVITARKLQKDSRKERNQGVTRETIFAQYLEGSKVTADLRNAQEQDTTCAQLREYLETETLPAVTDRASLMRARWIVRESRHLGVRGGLLVKIQGDNNTVVIPDSMRVPLITAFHDQLGHPGRGATLKMLRTRYYWPGMQADVFDYVAQCHECTLSKPPLRHRTARARAIGSYPSDLWYVDIVDMADTVDSDQASKAPDGEKGAFTKMVVFVDSLSRWVEAVPCRGDPSSADVLDAFITYILARHGAPRGIATDLGSNVASQLCQEICKQTGVDLSFSPAHHHEAAGAVERVHQTLIRMTRASDEGGEHWTDHLPFLLMSYRATPNRITEMSPAELIYGRQFRLPAQLGTALGLPDDEGVDPAIPELPPPVASYADRLNRRLRLAWSLAVELREYHQVAENASSTAMKSPAVPQSYEVNDRVCRLLPDSANKLSYLYAGPYRVKEVLSDGRYRLDDLENQMISDTFDVSQLRPYLTQVDAEELQRDEFVVDELMAHRMNGGQREYQVKWRGYPRSQATWEPRVELMRRCDTMIEEYESKHERRPPRAPRVAPPPQALPDRAVPRQQSEYESEDMPSIARFARGRWEYGRQIATPRGLSLRWYQPSAFTQDLLDSTHFQQLRETVTTPAEQAEVHAVIQWELYEKSNCNKTKTTTNNLDGLLSIPG